MTLTKKQRTALLIGLAMLLGSYVVRSLITAAMQAAYYQEQAVRAAQQRQRPKPKSPSPASAAPAVAAPATAATPAGAPAPPPKAGAPLGRLAGIWRGRAAIPDRGICGLKFELSETEPGRFSGYSTLACAYFAPLMSQQNRVRSASAVLNRMNPAAAVLTGAMQDGAIRFSVDKTVGADSHGCAPTSFTLTPFGANQLAAEWKEATCQGGHLILQKARQ